MSKLGLGRFKTWAGGVMSNSDARSNMSEELQRDLEEMDARCAGVERMDRAMHAYVKYLSKRVPGENKDTPFPAANLGATMVRQGDEMPRDSEFGGRLARFGNANVRIASFQEQFAAEATSSWQEELDRSLAQMKDYQAARKTLEMRRKESDAATTRIAKAKKEDPAAEEDLRRKTALYEESQRDVVRRIQDIRDAEDERMEGLSRFLEAELAFHENSANALQRLKSEWESRGVTQRSASSSRLAPPPLTGRPRSNTARSTTNYATVNEEEEYSHSYSAPRPAFNNYNRSNSYTNSYGDDESPAGSYSGQSHSRSHSPDPFKNSYRNPTSGPTFEGPTSSARRNGTVRDESYFPPPPVVPLRDRERANTLPAHPSPQMPLRTKRSQNIFHSQSDYDSLEDTPAYRPRTPSTSSPSTTPGSDVQRVVGAAVSGRKGPPPPPPSRAKKPPPPPPKRMMSASYIV
ncbi:hypothetical protein KEM56_000220 [Ascosphaera pollenicola]|nr:hypothetical protein KEM56_000220 [Ascosphaera pollenicola]